MKRVVLFLSALAVLTACGDNLSSQQEKAGRAATAFAEAYFNYELSKAAGLTTPETKKWISFAASGLTQEDVDVLNTRNEAATVTLTACEMVGDTVCEACIVVDNYLAADSIGRPLQLRSDDDFRLTLVLRDGRWLVRMAGLPRSEKRSRD